MIVQENLTDALEETNIDILVFFVALRSLLFQVFSPFFTTPQTSNAGYSLKKSLNRGMSPFSAELTRALIEKTSTR